MKQSFFTARTFTAVDCGALTDPMNGLVDTSSGTTFMNTATYTCNNGYTLTGDATRTCQDNGEWSGSASTCESKYISSLNVVLISTFPPPVPIVTCPTLPNPMNGIVDMSSNTEGSTATYTCNSGFGVNGAESSMCENSGSWSADPPTCQRELILTVYSPCINISLYVQLCVLDCPLTMEWSCSILQALCLRV